MKQLKQRSSHPAVGRAAGCCLLLALLILSVVTGQAQNGGEQHRGADSDRDDVRRDKDPFRRCESSGVIQAPALPGAQPISSRDRVYTADQTSNTVSVIDPSTNTLLGTIALGNARPDDLLGALYNKQINVHGLGFSNDGSLLNVVSVTTNGVSIIETATNKVIGTVYLRRAPHEGFFTPDCRELWVAVRGENFVSVIDVRKLREVDRIVTTDGAAMVIFRPDGQVAFVNSSRKPELDVIDVKSHRVIRRITRLVSPFSPNLAASPDNREVWLTHKDVGKVTIVDAQNFNVLGVIDTGMTTNHVNFVTKPDGNFAYVTVGGENVVKVYRRNGGHPQLVATIPTGAEPHGIWPSPDNTRVYIVLENGDAVQVIDTATNRVIDTIKSGQMGQALVYVANAVPSGDGSIGLTRQNVGLRIEEQKITVVGGGEATVILRELIGVDSVEVDATGLTPGAKYNVYAVKADGTRQLIGDLKADEKGKGSIDPLLKFFDAGFTRFEVEPAG
jgi:YVTN family beta-propeller protein